MSFWEVLWTIGSVASILSLFIIMLGDKRRTIVSYILNNRGTILFYVYIVFISLFTLLFLFVFIYLPISLRIFSLSWVLILIIVIFSILGLWSPIVASRQFWHGRLIKIWRWMIISLSLLLLIGYWIFSWPSDLYTPSLVTGSAIVLLVVYFIGEYWDIIKNKAIQYWSSAKTRIIEYWNKTKTSIQKVSHTAKTRIIEYWSRTKTRIQKIIQARRPEEKQ